MQAEQQADEMFSHLTSGHRRTLATALSLVESTAQADAALRTALLERLTLHQPTQPTRRIAVSGSPGVGKSTLLESLGLALIERGHRVAVLTVDPSSHRTGGSILGDKVRMPRLAVNMEAFVRPSASRTAAGGTTDSMRDSISVCEAAGFNTVIVETVGVGQNEVAAASMVDLFLLLVLPNSGDDLQGIKRGIMEVADVIVITKSDLDSAAANRAAAIFQSALRLMMPSREQWTNEVVQTSGLNANGVEHLVGVIDGFFTPSRKPVIDSERGRQRAAWFTESVNRALGALIASSDSVAHLLEEYQLRAASGSLHPTLAAQSFTASLCLTLTESHHEN
jgi:LAO/AO transport system kinase